MGLSLFGLCAAFLPSVSDLIGPSDSRLMYPSGRPFLPANRIKTLLVPGVKKFDNRGVSLGLLGNG